MKKFLSAAILSVVASLQVHAIIVYGESNEDAAVDYSNASNAELSVASLAGGSAVYLGNGWFITANHVNLDVGSTVKQNSKSATVSYIDKTLSSMYGADLKMFYVADAETSLTSLASVSLSSPAASNIAGVSFGYSGNPISGYNLTYTVKSSVKLIGAGYGRISTSNLTDEKVKAVGLSGIVHSGEASVYSAETINGYKYFITMAETKDGSAQAMLCDSGGGMFYEYNGETYLIGILVNVNGSTTETSFGDFAAAQLILDGKGQPTSEVDTKYLMDNYSFSMALNLNDYISQINNIISKNPIPEPAEYAFYLGLFSLLFLTYKRCKSAK